MNRNTLHHRMLVLLLAAAGLPAAAQEMPRSVAEAMRMERAVALPRTAFYATPATLATTAPGALLRQEPHAGYQLPAGTTAVRILYHSLDAEGRDVATSAVVLVPAGAPPSGGWPVIAWAHGTSGVAEQCAPSLMKDLYYGDEGLADMVAAGFAVVATDYHGLGTRGPHQYVSKVPQAHDVIYSIPAARAAVATLGKRWVVDGHSQGGLAAWGVAEAEADGRDADFLGAVSVAGATDLEGLLTHLGTTPGVGFYLSFMAFGVHARFPEFSPAEMLTPTAMQYYRRATTGGCWYRGYALYRNVPSTAILRAGWTSNVWVQRYFREAEYGAARVPSPVLVIAGEADQSVPLGSVREVVARACRAGTAITFRTYPGLDHDPTMQQSVADQLAWIRERFAGRPVTSTCGAAGNAAPHP